MSQLTVIIPAYNEQESLPSLLDRLDHSLRKAKISYRAIIVDDHSTDSTVRALHRFTKKYPLQVVTKKGARGKAQSILEGAALAKSEYLVMLDADLQYPPEAIPEMFRYATEGNHGVVVARRKVYDESMVRKIGSRGLALLCGKILHGFSVDIQSGLKLFKKDILSYIDSRDVTPWSIDLPLLHTAKELGFTIGEVEIDFVKRPYGESKLSLLGPTVQIIHTAIKLKFRRIGAEQTEPTHKGNMAGAGVKYRGKTFVTHSTLHHSKSALTVITPAQRSFLFVLAGIFLIGLGLNALFTVQVFVAILSFVYFIDVIFNFFLILKSLHSPPEISPTKAEILAIKDKDLPIYTILCPLYKEAHVIPQFVEAISAMDWPKDKLEVMLLLEEDDVESVEAVKLMNLPKYIRAVVVPDSQPKTKPKACNYGLNLAKGEYVVIYDAEDKPAVDQLKIAYLAFQSVGPEVKCLQAKLNYYNPTQNWLTRLFTAEYSLWFDVILTGLQSIGTTIPLGGTSNHFRTTDLLDFEGWDPFNVTEDCDLGVRLFKRGAKTAIIDSTTLEEANSNFRNWIRQRSRWIKGYMQTYLLHMRDPKGFADGQGIHALLFQLTVGGKIAFILINPILWVLTISYFVLYRYVGLTIESLYPSTVFYMAVTSLIFGNFMFIYYYMIGAAKRGHWGLMKWIYLVPLYWLMVSIAGAMALYQLIMKPHYWEKTIHGLHLKKAIQKEVRKDVISVIAGIASQAFEFTSQRTDIYAINFQVLGKKNVSRMIDIRDRLSKRKIMSGLSLLRDPKYRDGMLLLAMTFVGNFLNLATNLYLGKKLSFEDFGAFNLFISILYLSNIPIGALSKTMNFKTGYILGKHNTETVQEFWRDIRRKSIYLSILVTGIWIACIPFLPSFFHTSTIVPFLLFTPIWAISIVGAVDQGYMSGRMMFGAIAVLTITQPLARFIFAVVFTNTIPHLNYLAVVVGLFIVGAVSYIYARNGEDAGVERQEFKLPRSFFFNSLVAGFSSIAFFSLDTLLIAHYLPQVDVGRYGLIGLVGKMIYFISSLAATFLSPIVARNEGKGANSERVFNLTLLGVATLSACAYIGALVVVQVFGVAIFGSKISAVSFLIPIYGIGISAFALAQVFVSYHLLKRQYIFPVTASLLGLIQIGALFFFHSSLEAVVIVMTVVGLLHLSVMGLLHAFYLQTLIVLHNIHDLVGLLLPVKMSKKTKNGQHVLILNWRDTKHVWAGGAEVYLHELAKELIAHGFEVTVFCGNDGNSNRSEVVDGVRVIRRGGTYTVYVWAFLYYILRFRGDVDFLIDSENGVPFLSPLYSSVPVYLLIHHVHQNVFREHLKFPLKQIALFIEAKVMPMLYEYTQVITVSESSKKEVLDLGIGTKHSIQVINPGVSIAFNKAKKKTTYPTICYVGRLKPYKNVDVAIRAFARVATEYPKARFCIAGFGESKPALQKLVEMLGMEKQIVFLGRISDEEKSELLSTSWLMVQPSMIEGWGITVIEANTCGTPVIASDVEGLRDSIKDKETGILVPVGDVDAFSTAIKGLIGDKKRREKLSKQALLWSASFSWKHSTIQYIELFNRSLKDSSRSGASTVMGAHLPHKD